MIISTEYRRVYKIDRPFYFRNLLIEFFGKSYREIKLKEDGPSSRHQDVVVQ